MWDADFTALKVQECAPLLRFSKHERHFPALPERFRLRSTLGESNFMGHKDRYWDTTTGGWREMREGPIAAGPDWGVVLNSLQTETTHERPEGISIAGDVTRPRDERNLWRLSDSHRGFYLELDEGYARAESGANPALPVPIFYDTFELETEVGLLIGISYWIFYEYNWHVVFAHEGDWEHITAYFLPENHHAPGVRPDWVYFSAHNGGRLFPLGHESLSWRDRHPVVYVSHWGHPCYPTVAAGQKNDYGRYDWRTWEQPLLSLESQPWFRYDGAWGEVGESGHSTGPLGPWFKRKRDMPVFRRTP